MVTVACNCNEVSKRCALLRRRGNPSNPEAGEVMMPCQHWIHGECLARWAKMVCWGGQLQVGSAVWVHHAPGLDGSFLVVLGALRVSD